jgi:chaperone modulatory protein CbpM
MTETLLTISFGELCQSESIASEVVIDIVEYGIAQPIRGREIVDWVFDTDSVHWIKKAVRINQDLEIDWIAVALVIDLMQQKESLERENKCYQEQLKRFIK